MAPGVPAVLERRRMTAGNAGARGRQRAVPRGPCRPTPRRVGTLRACRLLLEQLAAARDEDLRHVAREAGLGLDERGDPLDLGVLGDLALQADDRLGGLLGEGEVLRGGLLGRLDE